MSKPNKKRKFYGCPAASESPEKVRLLVTDDIRDAGVI